MILKSFEVLKYKNVRCSGEVRIRDDVTCLVGKNESGKSALLQALYRLNPQPTGHQESFVGLRDYPRRHFGRDRDRVSSTRPVTATFELEDEDVEAVEEIHGRGVLASRTLTVSKSYENQLCIEFEIDETRAQASGLGSRGAGTTTSDDAAEPSARSRGAGLREQEMAERVRAPCARAGVRGTLELLLPRFLYFDEYSVMSGRVSVPRLQGGDETALTPGEHTTLALLRLANVDLADFTREEYEARRASLEAAANQLTNDVFSYWSQNRSLSVELDVDFDRTDPRGETGPFIELRVRNHRHGVTLNFSERSQGFTWFFSFLASLSALRDAGRMILLLDEPGLGLHASAQGDLLRFVDERLAPRHQVLYSTHSPFMVASTALERVRTVEDRDSEGTRVSHEFIDHSHDTRLPLQAALCHELTRSLSPGIGTLLVREPSDQVVLRAVSGRLEARGRSYLDPRWTIVPVGGLSGVATFVALLATRPLGLAIMADRPAGESATLDSPLGRRMLAEQGVVRVSEFAATKTSAGGSDSGPTDGTAANANGTPSEDGPPGGAQFTPEGADVEDLFSEEFYVELVNRSGAATIEPFEVFGTGRIVERIEEATGVALDRLRAARLLLDQRADPLDLLDDEAVERFESLFQAINRLLPARDAARIQSSNPDSGESSHYSGAG